MREKIMPLSLLVAMSALAAEPVPAPTTASPATILMDGAFLVRVRAQHDAELMKRVASEAKEAMAGAPTSVMDKSVVPPSGDKHDYMSQAPYFWPNPKTPNHLPYIRKDGLRNPEILKITDHDELAAMTRRVHALALGYFFTGEEDYAARASQLLRVWFLDPATRMNPNLQFAQGVPGVTDGRGTGILDARDLAGVVDGLALMASSASWTKADDAALHAWFESYFTWLTTSKNGKSEEAAKNNHGTWDDVQVQSIALYLGKTEFAKKLAEQAKTRRIGVQIEPDGQQPLEEERTKSFGYCVLNLEGLMTLADMSGVAGVDLWSYRSEHGGSIRGALDYLLPYAEKEKVWQHEDILGFPGDELRKALLMAAAEFHDAKYEQAAMKLKGHQDAQSLLLERKFAETTNPGEKTR